MKIRFASRSSVVGRKHNYYLVVDTVTCTAHLMACSQMTHSLQQVAKEPALLAFAIEDECAEQNAFGNIVSRASDATHNLLKLLEKYSPDEQWTFHSRTVR